MDLTSYVDSLGRELLTVAETGGDEAKALVERLTITMDSAIRLTLLEALSAAADEITRDLAPGSVELRLRGRDPNFVVTVPPSEQVRDNTVDTTAPSDDAMPGIEDGPAVRINVRLPEQLKTAIEEAAAKEGRSLNAWLVRAATAALQPVDRNPGAVWRGKRSTQSYSGWAR